MTIGTLRIEAAVDAANSLKDKRRVVKSLKDRLRNRFNVAVAELDFMDEWRRTEIGVATLANDGRVVSGVLSQVENFVRSSPGLILIHADKEIL